MEVDKYARLDFYTDPPMTNGVYFVIAKQDEKEYKTVLEYFYAWVVDDEDIDIIGYYE